MTPLARRGTLWTLTTQDFLPKEPYAGPETEDDFAGFLLGYVELPDGVIVESAAHRRRSRRVCRSAWTMELALVPFGTRRRRHRGAGLRLRSPSAIPA